MLIWIYEHLRKANMGKQCKRALALALVFAMLASFAGMTGFAGNPFAIEAKAISWSTTTTDKAALSYSSSAAKVTYTYTDKYGDDAAGRPKDSMAGRNKPTINFPTTLYSNSGTIVDNANDYSSTTTTSAALTSKVTVSAAGASEITLNIINYDESIRCYNTVTAASATFDLNGSSVSTISNDGTYVYYRVDIVYKNVTTPAGGSASQVTYSQFGASKIVTSIPRFKLAEVWWIPDAHDPDGTKHDENCMFTYFNQVVNAGAFLNENGFALQHGWSGGTQEGGDYNAGNYEGPNEPNGDYNSIKSRTGAAKDDGATYFYYNSFKRGDLPHVIQGWSSGSEDGSGSSAAIGLTITYDPRATRSGNVVGNISTISKLTGDEGASDGTNYHNTGATFYKLTQNAKNFTYNEYLADTQDEQRQSDTSIIFNNIETASSTATNAWASGMTAVGNSKTSASVNMTFKSSMFNSSATTAKTYHLQMHSGSRGVLSNGNTRYVALSYAYYFEMVPVSLNNAHDLIEKALSCNYVKAEMEDNWWNGYRQAVLDAYVATANFTANADIAADRINSLKDPKYVTADYTALYNAFIATAAWDLGNNSNVADGVNRVGEHKADSSRTRTGKYYYTAASWSTYETARNKAYKYLCYPGSSVSAYSYGTVPNHSNTTNAGCFVYCQSYIDEALNGNTSTGAPSFASAKNGLTPDLADVSALGAKIDGSWYDSVLTSALISDIEKDAGYDETAYAKYEAMRYYAATIYYDNTSSTTLNKNTTYSSATNGKIDDFRQDLPLYSSGNKNYVASNGVTVTITIPSHNSREEEIAWIASELASAWSALKPLTLAEYKDSTFGVTGYAKILATMQNEITRLKNETIDYSTYDASTNKLGTAQANKYANVNGTELDAIMDAFTACGFKASDYKYVKGEDLAKAITAFKNSADNATLNSVRTDAWVSMLNRVKENIDPDDTSFNPSASGFDDDSIIKFLEKEYNLSSTDISAITAIILKFENTETANANSQADMNAVEKQLYDWLTKGLPSKTVIAHANQLDSDVKGETFDIYDYHPDTATSDVKYEERMVYDDDSYANFVAALNTAKAVSYNILTNDIAALEKAAAGIDYYKNLTTDSTPGYLKHRDTFNDYLLNAIAYAKNYIATTNSQYVTNPADGSQTEFSPKYTQKSINEVEALIKAAEDFVTNHPHADSKDNQWMVDFYTFVIYDELDSSLEYQLCSNLESPAVEFTYGDDGVTVTGIEYKIETYEQAYDYLYNGNRSKNANGYGEAGLEGGPANLTYINQWLNAYKDEYSRDGVNYVWQLDGSNVTGFVQEEGAALANGASIFGDTWTTYISAYNAAMNIKNGTNRTYTASDADMKDVDKAAKDLYDAFNALTPGNFSVNKVPYANAVSYFNALDSKYNTVANSTVGIHTYTVNAVDGVEKSTTTKTVYEDDDPSTADNLIYLYNGDIESFKAQISAFQAAYAAVTPTASYFSEEAMEEAYAAIRAAEENITLKTFADEDQALLKGLRQLETDFIAGTVDEDGNYSTDLLSEEQAADIQQYLTGNGSANYIGAYGVIAGEYEDAASLQAAVADLYKYADDIYTYTTTTNATEMPFAVAMRDQLYYEFLEGIVEFEDEFYYGSEASAEMSYEVFMSDAIETYVKSPIESLFGTPTKWPLIYRMNGVDVLTDVEVPYTFVEVDPDTGESYESEMVCTRAYDLAGYSSTGIGESYTYSGNKTAATDDIINILNLIGPFAKSYETAQSYFNDFDFAALDWITNTALYKQGQKTYVLATLSQADIDNGRPLDYDMSAWYNEGYGISINNSIYYVYSDESDEYKTNKFNKNGGWFKSGIDDEAILTGIGVEGITDITLLKKEANIGSRVWPAMDLALDMLETCGMCGGISIVSAAIETQFALSSVANTYYSALQGLELLPATQAYRDVTELYYTMKGMNVNFDEYAPDDKLTISSYVVPDSEHLENAEILDGAYFYQNPNDTAFFEQVYNLTKHDITYYPFDTKYSTNTFKTGLVYDLPGAYNNTEAIDNFFNEKIANAELVTIDKQVLVNGDYSTGSLIKGLLDAADSLVIQGYDFAPLNTLINYVLNNPEKQGDIYSAANSLGDTEREDLGLSSTEEAKYYTWIYYTDESLIELVRWMGSTDIGLISESICNSVYENTATGTNLVDGFAFNLSFDYETQGGTFFTKPSFMGKKAHEAISEITLELGRRITALELRPADEEKELLDSVYGVELDNPRVEEVYNTDSEEGLAAWTRYVNAMKAAEDLMTIEEFMSKVDYEEQLTDAKEELELAIAGLIYRDDRTAPTMTVLSSQTAIEDFYTNVLQSSEKPGIGTFLMPGKSGYTLMVYTNQLNPKVIINLQDLNEKVGADLSGEIQAKKEEEITITATRTSGTVANVVIGSLNEKGLSDGYQTVAVSGTTPATVTNNSSAKGTAAYAVLAPQFVAGTKTQAALYKVVGKDGMDIVSTDLNIRDADGNDKVASDTAAEKNGFTVYIYYMGTMQDGNDEGIDAAGNVISLGSYNAPVVRSANEELTNSKAWTTTGSLSRYFSGVSNWEFVSQNVDGVINAGDAQSEATGIPVYNDPSFRLLNTGSFVYVLDKNDTTAAENVKSESLIFSEYHATKQNNATASTEIDYAAASQAKRDLIDTINAGGVQRVDAMRSSGRFFDYGAGQNWYKILSAEYPNGTLVFVHVLDRWGNVCNRIIEIVRTDDVVPAIKAQGVGAATITESGGAGIARVSVWDWMTTGADRTESDVSINDNGTQKVSGLNGTEVRVAGNVLTVSGLIPGKKYEVGATDNAGSVGRAAVAADTDGNIAITVIDEGDTESVQSVPAMTDLEEMSFELNGFATVYLNSIAPSSIINAKVEGNVMAGSKIYHYIDTMAGVTQLRIVDTATGVADEWSTSKASVKENADGTLTWRVYRKLAEGEHSFTVTAMVDGAYEDISVPFTITATTKTVKLSVDVHGLGYTYINYSGSKDVLNTTYKTETVPYGAVVAVTAHALDADKEFKYWINDDTDRIISTEGMVEFKAVANVDYVAQFTTEAIANSGKKMVIYVNNANNIIDSFDVAQGESYPIPAAPILPDYRFVSWSMSQAEVLASTEDTVIVRPVYVLNANYFVSITQGDYTVTGAGEYKSTDSSRAIVNISASETNGAGEAFLYWLDEETQEIASYSRIYSFYCLRDITLTPVYGEPEGEAQPAIRIADIKYDAGLNKVNFYAERSIPDGYSVLRTGIIVTKTAEIAQSDDLFVIGTDSVSTGTSTSTANSGYYSASVSLFEGSTVWAKAYAICETADGDICYIYGSTVSYTA